MGTKLANFEETRVGLVGARGFEPPTPCAQGRCATRLRYAPTESSLYRMFHFIHPMVTRLRTMT